MDTPERRLAFSATRLLPLASTETSGSDGRLRRKWTHLLSASPGRIALLWAIATLLDIAGTVVFPNGDARLVSSTLYLSGISIFSGLLVAWVLRLGRSTFILLSALMSLRLLASLSALTLKLAMPASFDLYIDAIMGGLFLLATALMIWFGYGAARRGAGGAEPPPSWYA